MKKLMERSYTAITISNHNLTNNCSIMLWGKFGKKLHRYCNNQNSRNNCSIILGGKLWKEATPVKNCNNQNLTNNCSILLSGESFGKTLHRYCNNQKFEKQLQHNVVLLGEVLERSYRYCNNKQLQHNVVVGEVLK